MSQKMSIALGSAEDAAKDFIEAWHCAQRGETHQGATEKLYFEDLETLLRVLNQRRWQLLKTLRLAGPTDTPTLSQKLHRNDQEIQKDINELEQSGLILRTATNQIAAPWDVVEAQLKLVPCV
jgi:predicted transcriptional regulator